MRAAPLFFSRFSGAGRRGIQYSGVLPSPQRALRLSPHEIEGDPLRAKIRAIQQTTIVTTYLG